jgi:hypothetical protein
VKLRSLQLTRMFLRILECRHLVGIRYGGKYETLFSAPRQSETISTRPFSVGYILFTLRSRRWMAMSPRSSPRYAFATARHSKNDPTIRPHPLLHSRTKAAEHKLGYSSCVYELSVTATSAPLLMEWCSHSVSPDMEVFSHSQVLPHDLRTSRIVAGTGVTATVFVVERSRQ